VNNTTSKSLASPSIPVRDRWQAAVHPHGPAQGTGDLLVRGGRHVKAVNDKDRKRISGLGGCDLSDVTLSGYLVRP
jgi:hypothetical protein